MGYCSIADIKIVIPEQIMIRLTAASEMMQERLDDLSEDDQIIQEYIDQASAEIDGYIGGRLRLPLLEPYPPMLIKLCIDISAYNLYSLLRDIKMPDTRRSRYDDAVNFLRRFADGNGYLPGAVVDGETSIVFTSEARRFTRTGLRAF